MEEKIYSRAVNKSNLGLRVIDGKLLRRCFSRKEVENLQVNDDWAQCDACSKWRMFPPSANVDTEALPDKVSPRQGLP